MRGGLFPNVYFRSSLEVFGVGRDSPADTVPQNFDQAFYQQIPSYLPLSAGRRAFSRFTRSRMM